MHLVVDLSNVAWIKRFGHLRTKTKESYAKELICQEVLNQIFTVYKQYSCSNLIIAVDGKNTWRKDKYEFYKANRDTTYDLYFDEVMGAIDEIKNFFSDSTNCYCVKVEGAEADDVIYVLSKQLQDNLVVLSNDGDFHQLLKNGTTLFNPIKKEEKESVDPDYDLFLKCFRGDRGDNILSAYPNLRETKIKKAYSDPYEKMNLMNETLKDGTLVSESFEFNRSLIDLSCSPDWIRDNIKDEISRQQSLERTYSYMKVLKNLKNMGIKSYALKNLDQHVFILKGKKDIF